MDLESRLGLLRRQAGGRAPAGRSEADRLLERLRGLDRRRATPSPAAAALSPRALADRLGGDIPAEGVVRLRRRIDVAGSGHPGSRHELHPLLEGGLPANRRRLYLDTETTGLSGGSGTLAFLVGVAEAADDRLVITQYLLTGYAGEPAMLELIAEGLSPGDVLVTYNGKSFDLPLLATRYRINGLADPLAHLAHCDLLHPVRRLFSSRWPDCRLATAESALLGYRRRGDLPGAFAPDAWFAYLRRGDASALAAVCEHNARDLASLPALRAVLHAAVSTPEPGKVDIGALAGWLRRTDEPAALELLAAHEAHLSGPGLRLLGDLLRRAGRTGEASRVWDALAASGCVRATEQLAKYQEHVRKDIASALGYADRLPDSAARRHRVDRLRKKLNRAAAGLDFENRPDP